MAKDLNLRVEADVLGICPEDFSDHGVYYQSLYPGMESLELPLSELDSSNEQGGLRPHQKVQGFPHRFLILTWDQNSAASGLARWFAGKLVPLDIGDKEGFGVWARNTKQKFAIRDGEPSPASAE